MADQDDSQKTEEPTARRLQKAFEEGQVAKSQDLTIWFSLAAAALIFAVGSGPMASYLRGHLVGFLERPHTMVLDGQSLQAMMASLLLTVLMVLGLPALVLMAAGIAGTLVQHRPTFSTKQMEPKLDKLNPLKGVQRILGVQGWLNLGKALVKLVAAGAIVYWVLWPEAGLLYGLVQSDPTAIFPVAKALSLRILGGILFVSFVLALIDFAYQKYSHHQKMMMSRKEIKDEHKELDGDPQVKAKIKQVRQERSRQRMMAAVPDATVVVTNPTHYAVALKYVEGETAAPVCVAKGTDELALRIRAVAKEADVPVVENPPLARALHATVEIDEEVPQEHYKAVAEVIGYVYRLRAKARPRSASRG